MPSLSGRLTLSLQSQRWLVMVSDRWLRPIHHPPTLGHERHRVWNRGVLGVKADFKGAGFGSDVGVLGPQQVSAAGGESIRAAAGGRDEDVSDFAVHGVAV